MSKELKKQSKDWNIKDMFCVFSKTVLAGKKTGQCKSWIKIATKYREEKGIDDFNELLETFDKMKNDQESK